MVAIDEAIASAGLDSRDLKNLRVGVCLGSTMAGATNYQEKFGESYNRGEVPYSRTPL